MGNPALEAAEKYKKDRENMNLWTYSYSKGDNNFWCLNYYRKKNENTGFYIYSSLPADSVDFLEAFWNLSTSSSLVNNVTKEMSVHYNKSLNYLKDLEMLLIQWKRKYPADAEKFKTYIDEYLEMVKFYEHGKVKIKRLNTNLLDIEKSTLNKGVLSEKDTETIILNSAEYNFQIFTELHMQKDTIQGISKIDAWLKENRKITDFFSNTKKLIRYTDYYINPESVRNIDRSLENFKFTENSTGGLIYEMEQKEGKALFTERYTKKLKNNFEKEFIPMLRNPI
ncbi:hypothetical protein [Bacillus sp. UMB0728]|uniref:hypothetical protein n=1 Tax=Bacillus sp. UMB0728 TaxID=2066052 RepID=UPI000C770761|nr:hypothetical protein [Bacillus sp. UMB0728]PLR70140.1 hypothetical protein CYJ37_25815 [Bacillus sp. UMB0728]